MLPNVRYWGNNGQKQILACDGLSANDPKRAYEGSCLGCPCRLLSDDPSVRPGSLGFSLTARNIRQIAVSVS